jgi:predicted nucleic acid-binding protein
MDYLNGKRSGTSFVLAPQSLFEAWVVLTRPAAVNGYGFSTAEAYSQIDAARSLFQVFPDPPNLLDEWLDLCRSHEVSGKNAHDARLAAYARLNNIKTLITLNPRDFARYGLTVIVP